MPEGSGGSIWKGIGLAGAINLGALLFGAITIAVGIGIVIVAGFAGVQFAWLLPLFFSFRKKGQPETAKGILIAAGITVLLSAGCWGLVGNMQFR